MMRERPSFQLDQPRRELNFAHHSVVRPKWRWAKAVENLRGRGRAGPNQRCDSDYLSPFHACFIIDNSGIALASWGPSFCPLASATIGARPVGADLLEPSLRPP